MILLIDNYDSFTFNLFQMISSFGVDVKVVRNNEITIEQIKKLRPSGIIMSPGPKYPKDAGICLELTKEFLGKIPLFGVCLGHQIIAEALGGKVEKAKSVVHGKSAKIFHTRKGLFKNMPLPFDAGRYHSLVVSKEHLPKDLSVEAETVDGTLMAIKHNKYDCYGVQFHPESILSESGSTLIEAFLGVCNEKTS